LNLYDERKQNKPLFEFYACEGKFIKTLTGRNPNGQKRLRTVKKNKINCNFLIILQNMRSDALKRCPMYILLDASPKV